MVPAFTYVNISQSSMLMRGAYLLVVGSRIIPKKGKWVDMSALHHFGHMLIDCC